MEPKTGNQLLLKRDIEFLLGQDKQILFRFKAGRKFYFQCKKKLFITTPAGFNVSKELYYCNTDLMSEDMSFGFEPKDLEGYGHATKTIDPRVS